MAGRKFLLKQDISNDCSDHKTKTKITNDNLYLQKFSISQKMRKRKLVKGDDLLCSAMINFTTNDMLPDGKGNFVPSDKRRCKNKHRSGSEYCYIHRGLEGVGTSTSTAV